MLVSKVTVEHQRGQKHRGQWKTLKRSGFCRIFSHASFRVWGLECVFSHLRLLMRPVQAGLQPMKSKTLVGYLWDKRRRRLHLFWNTDQWQLVFLPGLHFMKIKPIYSPNMPGNQFWRRHRSGHPINKQTQTQWIQRKTDGKKKNPQKSETSRITYSCFHLCLCLSEFWCLCLCITHEHTPAHALAQLNVG